MQTNADRGKGCLVVSGHIFFRIRPFKGREGTTSHFISSLYISILIKKSRLSKNDE